MKYNMKSHPTLYKGTIFRIQISLAYIEPLKNFGRFVRVARHPEAPKSQEGEK